MIPPPGGPESWSLAQAAAGTRMKAHTAAAHAIEPRRKPLLTGLSPIARRAASWMRRTWPVPSGATSENYPPPSTYFPRLASLRFSFDPLHWGPADPKRTMREKSTLKARIRCQASQARRLPGRFSQSPLISAGITSTRRARAWCRAPAPSGPRAHRRQGWWPRSAPFRSGPFISFRA